MKFKVGDTIRIISKSIHSGGLPLFGKKGIVTEIRYNDTFVYELVDVPERKGINHYSYGEDSENYELVIPPPVTPPSDKRLIQWLLK